jgi:hypothetical protein
VAVADLDAAILPDSQMSVSHLNIGDDQSPSGDSSVSGSHGCSDGGTSPGKGWSRLGVR